MDGEGRTGPSIYVIYEPLRFECSHLGSCGVAIVHRVFGLHQLPCSFDHHPAERSHTLFRTDVRTLEQNSELKHRRFCHYWFRNYILSQGTTENYLFSCPWLQCQTSMHAHWLQCFSIWRHFRWSAFVAMAIYSVTVETKFHLECKLRFSYAQFTLRKDALH